MKKSVFKGVATALITPMDKFGKIDYEAFGRFLDWQVNEGVNAVVVCGTTGESSTMTDAEHKDAIAFVVERINHRIPVIAGTGSNDTEYAISMTKHAAELGVDAALVVTPYYNKATQNGLIKMYTKLADESAVPIIMYNVPSRTGVNIEPTTYRALSEHPNIAAIKEANGNISKIVETMSYVDGKLDLYSGNDDQIVPLLSLGGKGVISVLSNVMPRKTVELCDKYFAGDVEGARKLQFEMHALIDALFCEVNPIPVKAACSAMGFCENVLRLPLTEMSEDKRLKMLDIMRGHGLKV